MNESDWLLFMAQLPATPSSLRVNVWRRLREAGSASLQNGVWILPRTPENTLFMERLLVYVKQNGAGGQIFLVQGVNQAIQDDMVARFVAERDQEYDEFFEQCEAFIKEIDKETLHRKFTFAELEEAEQNLRRLQEWIARIQKRDFFPGEKSESSTHTLKACQAKLSNYTRQVFAREGIETPPSEGLPSDIDGSHD